MKKILVLIIFLISVIGNSYGQTLSEVLKNMPNSIVWGMTTEQKEELLTHPADSSLTIAGNDLYNKIIRKELSDDYIFLQTSESGSVEIKLLPLINDTKIICVVKTACKRICDSNISFYTSKWNIITDNKLFPNPTIKWFLKSDIDINNEDFKNAIASVDLLPVKFCLSPKDNILKAELEIKQYLDEKSYENIKPFLMSDPKLFVWNKTMFE